MNRHIHARIWPHVALACLCMVGPCYGKDSFYAHDPAEERSLIEFVRNHPEIDFSTYVTNGVPLLRYVTLCNYTNFLAFVEDARGAIRAYKPMGPEPTLLESARAFQLQDATDYLARIRPDWVFGTPHGPSVFSSVLLRDDVQQAKRFLDIGACVDAYRGKQDYIWMDEACHGSLELYELIRSRGERFGWDRPFSADRRRELLSKYSGDALHLHANALLRADGSRIDFLMAPDGTAISEKSLREIEDAIKAAGTRCHGTVLMIFHTPNAEPTNFRMEEIVDRANVAVVRIPAGMESTPAAWPMEYLPYQSESESE